MHHVAVQGQIIANDSGSMSWGHFLMVIKSHNLHHLIRRWIIHFPNKMIVFALIMHFYSGRSWTPTLPICRITSCGCAMIHNVTKESTSLACPHRAAVNLDYRFQWKPITLFSKRKWKSSQRPLKLPRKNCITNGSLIRGSSILVKKHCEKHATNDDQQNWQRRKHAKVQFVTVQRLMPMPTRGEKWSKTLLKYSAIFNDEKWTAVVGIDGVFFMERILRESLYFKFII